MNVRVKGLLLSATLGLWCAGPTTAEGAPVAGSLSERDADVRGTRLHYLIAGHGPAVLLLHGYAETSRMWRPIIPALSEKFTVIAPDLPGIGDSTIPVDGLDMKTAALRIHELVKSLNVAQARATT